MFLLLWFKNKSPNFYIKKFLYCHQHAVIVYTKSFIRNLFHCWEYSCFKMQQNMKLKYDKNSNIILEDADAPQTHSFLLHPCHMLILENRIYEYKERSHSWSLTSENQINIHNYIFNTSGWMCVFCEHVYFIKCKVFVWLSFQSLFCLVAIIKKLIWRKFSRKQILSKTFLRKIPQVRVSGQ